MRRKALAEIEKSTPKKRPSLKEKTATKRIAETSEEDEPVKKKAKKEKSMTRCDGCGMLFNKIANHLNSSRTCPHSNIYDPKWQERHANSVVYWKNRALKAEEKLADFADKWEDAIDLT